MFLEGRKHGVGHLTYPDGSTYEGEFVGDKRNGFGRYHSIRGNYIYEGTASYRVVYGIGVDDKQERGASRDNILSIFMSAVFSTRSVRIVYIF